jgi:hypothetical protein
MRTWFVMNGVMLGLSCNWICMVIGFYGNCSCEIWLEDFAGICEHVSLQLIYRARTVDLSRFCARVSAVIARFLNNNIALQ